MSNKKILFISHDASRTGAPIVLLHLLKWLKQNTDLDFIILLKKDGELRKEFESLATTYIYSFNYKPLIGIKGKITGNWNTFIGVPSHYRRLKKELISHNIGLVYANSIVNGEILHFLSFLTCKVITHVHELEYGFYFSGKENLKYLLQYTDRYIAVANAVKNTLINTYTVHEDHIDTIYEFVPTENKPLNDSNEIRQLLNIPEDAFIVGASGTMDLRKGFDLLVPLAQEVYKYVENDDYYFVWIGGNPNSDYYFIVNQDAEKTGMNKFIRLPGAQVDPLKYFACFDVFVMLSREDPFPLVCLEAALLGKPIICFEKSGGMPELVENDGGFVVPYLNLSVIAEKIIELNIDTDLKRRLGGTIQEKVKHRHDVSLAAPKILDIIESLM